MGGANKFGTSSWFKDLFSSLTKSSFNGGGSESVGKTWSSFEAERAFAKGELKSREAGSELRVGFRNQSKLPLLLAWISEEGKCHHFYTLKPAEILEGPVTALDHIENTCLGHSFVIACAGKEEEERVRQDKVLVPKYVIGGYRPDSIKSREDSTKYVHLVTISQVPSKKMVCCPAPLISSSSRGGEVGNNFDDLCWLVQVHESFVDGKQIDTSKKHYEKTVLGGWPVFLEPNWHDGDKDLERCLAEDLACAAKCLPPHARDFLRRNTPVYVNKSLCWGPEVRPIIGRGLCFHPESKWLEENFMNPEKCECVEIYTSKGYAEDRKLWGGKGGVLIHEFSHAYHHKCMEDGYDNNEIRECYDLAMKERLYDWLHVHGTQGPMAKAYASTNQMEYFAELSAAFLGQPDMHSEEEFNKWFPFNRRQVKEHDPRAYELLKKVWKVDD